MKALRHELFEKHGGKCYFCGRDTKPSLGWSYRPEFATVEHLIPRSKGGAGPENLVLACFGCNQKKGSMMPEEFMNTKKTGSKAAAELQSRLKKAIGGL